MSDTTTPAAVVETVANTPLNKKALVAAGVGLVVAGAVVLVVKRRALNKLVLDAVTETE